MVFYIIGGSLCSVSIMFLISAYFVRKSDLWFEENKQRGKGIIVGYDRKEQIIGKKYKHDLRIIIPEIGNSNSFLCISDGIDPMEYPIGSTVDIFYSRSSGRIPVIHAVLTNKTQQSFITFRILKCIGLILVIIGTICAIIGAITTII